MPLRVFSDAPLRRGSFSPNHHGISRLVGFAERRVWLPEEEKAQTVCRCLTGSPGFLALSVLVFPVGGAEVFFLSGTSEKSRMPVSTAALS